MKLRVPEGLVYSVLEGEAVILDLTGGTYFGLDPIGTRMWQLIEQLGSLDQIVSTLLTEFDVVEDRLRRDLDELIRTLVDKGLLRVEAD